MSDILQDQFVVLQEERCLRQIDEEVEAGEALCRRKRTDSRKTGYCKDVVFDG